MPSESSPGDILLQICDNLATPTRSAEEVLRLRDQTVLSDPMGKLPVDIASVIIGLCLPSLREGMPGPEEYGKQKLHNQILLALAEVSKSWREFVLLEHNRWTSLSFIVRLDNITTTTEIAKDWLERSEELPLSIKIYVPHDPTSRITSRQVEDFKSFSKIILVSCKRWEYLDLKMPAIFLDMFNGRLSNLRGIRIFDSSLYQLRYCEYYCLYSDSDDSDSNDEAADIGCLQTPTFLSIGFFSLENIGISWENLTRIEATGIRMRDVFELILEKLPQLEECELEDINCVLVDEEDEWCYLGVHHEALRHLRVKTSGGTSIIYQLFNLLTLPRLDTLYIEVLSKYGDPLSRNFGVATFLNRSNCPLMNLTVIGPSTNDNLIRTLREAPHLRRLVLQPVYYFFDEYDSYDYTAEILFQLISQTSIRDLSYTLPEDKFLPVLESITYRPNTPKDCQKIWDLIPDLFGVVDDPLAGAGNNIASPLRRPLVDVSIVYRPKLSDRPPPPFSEQTWARIVKLREMGLKIGATWSRNSTGDNHGTKKVTVMTSTEPVGSD